ncbi:hypothetical protein GHT06_013149 [Daphnia sinensis]|uniref:Uncharacterized protein n=1 Tax=Daphnia sinensis TaxID=1820382 RepID=A0AAD5PZN5_9CRUS|nr:hypothetical protein GHT06_013149 [Daphnia sinensis]
MTHCQSSHNDLCDPVINRFALRCVFHGLFSFEQIFAVNQLLSDGCVICALGIFGRDRSGQIELISHGILT